nr:MAG TPA: Protein of unknown function (DUF2730) [Bacteriophage sp.]
MSEAWITWIIQGLTGLAIGVIGYFIKRDRAALDEKLAQQDTRLEKQDSRIEQLEKDMKQLPFVYTTREDFIRATTQIDQKLDKILDRIADMKEVQP